MGMTGKKHRKQELAKRAKDARKLGQWRLKIIKLLKDNPSMSPEEAEIIAKGGQPKRRPSIWLV